MNKPYPRQHLLKYPLCIILIAMGTGSVPAWADEEEQAPATGQADQMQEEVAGQQDGEVPEPKITFPYTASDISSTLVSIKSKTATGDAAGSGFIAKMDGKTYIFTNQHTIMGADSIEFTTLAGECLKPTGVELSAKRDIVRLPIPDREDALAVNGNIGMGMPVAVFGSKKGEGSTELFGDITGVGAELMEVSAEFAAENSGSPVLNKDKEVIGIASYVRSSRPSRMTENTRFENQARRFCYRLTDVRWAPVNWRKYNEEYGKTYRENEALAGSIFDVINDLYDKPFGTVSENCTDTELKKWAGEHNRVISHHSNQLRREVGNSTEALSSYCKRRSKNLEMKLEKRDLTGFLREEFEGYIYTFDYASEVIDHFATKLPSFRL